MGSVKPTLQRSLQALGVYHRLQASLLYDLYWSFADVSILKAVRSEVGFYRQLLSGFRQGDLIFDIGANHGSKTDVFLRLGARVVAVEPDEINAGILQEKFLRYRLRPKPVAVVQKAVSDVSTTETMWIDSPGSAMNTFSAKWVNTLRADMTRFGHTLQFAQQRLVSTTTLEDLFITYGRPVFIKIDVEGHEVKVLRGMRQAVPYVSFEVNLPEFMAEGLECVSLLEGLAPHGRFNFVVDCKKGLAQHEWLTAKEFSRLLCDCGQKSIEVVCKTI